jgi:hypothetical protein
MRQAIKVDIDRLILTDLGLTPEQTKGMLPLLEAALKSQLLQAGWMGNPVNYEVTHLEAPPITLTAPHRDTHLAESLARGIVHALHSSSR